jgi:hypothetical protein
MNSGQIKSKSTRDLELTFFLDAYRCLWTYLGGCHSLANSLYHDIDLDNKKLKQNLKQHVFQKDPIDTLGYPDYEGGDLSTVHHDSIHKTVIAALTEAY